MPNFCVLTHLLQLALLAKLYKEPLPVLDVDIEDIDPAVSQTFDLSFFFMSSAKC
jgi:hypothetical protein